MKKLLLLLFLVTNFSFASSYNLSCITTTHEMNSGFTANYLISEDNQTILWVSSYIPGKPQTEKIGVGDSNEFLQIVSWEGGLVSAFANSEDNNPTSFLFNLNEGTYNSSAHYQGNAEPFVMAFKCKKTKVDIQAKKEKAGVIQKTSITDAKSQCTDIGFEADTEKFGDCVLELMQ